LNKTIPVNDHRSYLKSHSWSPVKVASVLETGQQTSGDCERRLACPAR